MTKLFKIGLTLFIIGWLVVASSFIGGLVLYGEPYLPGFKIGGCIAFPGVVLLLLTMLQVIWGD